MMTAAVEYLREIAQTCTRLARACPDLPTSRGLEEVAIDLMAKAKELEQTQLDHSDSIGSPLPKPAKIFIVDDDASVRQATETLVRTLGYETEAFVSGEDCIRRGHIAEASCLIIDVRMPGMTGFELHDRLRAKGYQLPVIFMSGCSEETLIEAAIRAGAIGLLDKPVDVQRLIDCLEKALKLRSSP